MNYIIFDLELNSKPFKSKIPNEIIEIGAVKLNENLDIIDIFQCFIKPKYFPKLFRTIREKTKIPQEDINNGQDFKTAIKEFCDWIGQDYYLISWGYDDFHHLKTNCTLYHMDLSWITNFVNIQKQFSTLQKMEKGKTFSLQNALNELEIPMVEEELHRAYIDAQYTSKIFVKIFDKINFE